jgi:hypothetical protein
MSQRELPKVAPWQLQLFGEIGKVDHTQSFALTNVHKGVHEQTEPQSLY